MSAITSCLAQNAASTYQLIADNPKTVGVIVLGAALVGASAMHSVAAAVATAAALALSAIVYIVISYLCEHHAEQIEAANLERAKLKQLALLDSLSEQAKMLFAPTMDLATKAKIAEVVQAIPADELAHFLDQISPIIKNCLMLEENRIRILKVMPQIPVTERNNFLRLIGRLRPRNMRDDDLVSLFENLKKIPASERTGFIAQVKHLALEKKQRVPDILIALLDSPSLQELSESEQTEFIQLLVRLIKQVDTEKLDNLD